MDVFFLKIGSLETLQEVFYINCEVVDGGGGGGVIGLRGEVDGNCLVGGARQRLQPDFDIKIHATHYVLYRKRRGLLKCFLKSFASLPS